MGCQGGGVKHYVKLFCCFWAGQEGVVESLRALTEIRRMLGMRPGMKWTRRASLRSGRSERWRHPGARQSAWAAGRRQQAQESHKTSREMTPSRTAQAPILQLRWPGGALVRLNDLKRRATFNRLIPITFLYFTICPNRKRFLTFNYME